MSAGLDGAAAGVDEGVTAALPGRAGVGCPVWFGVGCGEGADGGFQDRAGGLVQGELVVPDPGIAAFAGG